MLKKYKGQVSIFIIIGIILVIVTSFLFFNSKFELFVSHDTKLKNQVSTIVKDCVYNYADSGTFLLGFQGGYINIPKEIEANPTSYIDFGLKIPNWDSSVDRYPTISSMEGELNNYISENAMSCIENNLKTLTNLDVKIDDEFEVETRINDQNVVIESSLLITFNEVNSEEILSVSDYTIKLDDLRLGDLYKLAVEVYNVEDTSKLFESLTIEQIMSATDYSSKESMPSEGMTFSCAKRVWSIPQLQKNLASLNNNNFKYLQFEGTYSKQEVFDTNLEGFNDLREYYEKLYVFSLINPKSSFKNYNVEVFMPSTEITSKEGILRSYPFRKFEVTPSDGQIVESMDMEVELGIDIPIPCIQIFHHLYDLDYDLIVKLTDMNDDGRLFTFQFPLRVEIKHNTPKVEPVNFIPVETKTFSKASYCNDESYKYPLMVVTRDNSGNYLSDVNISYKCISVKCDMGITKKPVYDFAPDVEREYAQPELVADYPFCIGGQVIGEKEGYFKSEKRVDTDSALLRRESFVGDNLVELEMIPLKSFDIDESSFLVISRESGFGKRVLSEDDGSIYVSIKNDEYDYKSMAIWPTEKGFLDKLEFLDTPDVAYNLSLIYMNKDYDLKGIVELDNWEPQIHSGNNVQFTIPGKDSAIEEDDYLEFFEYAQNKILTDVDYEVRIN